MIFSVLMLSSVFDIASLVTVDIVVLISSFVVVETVVKVVVSNIIFSVVVIISSVVVAVVIIGETVVVTVNANLKLNDMYVLVTDRVPKTWVSEVPCRNGFKAS